MRKLTLVLFLILGISVYGVSYAELEVQDGPVTAEDVNVSGSVKVDSDTNGVGNLGVNVATPAAKLHIDAPDSGESLYGTWDQHIRLGGANDGSKYGNIIYDRTGSSDMYGLKLRAKETSDGFYFYGGSLSNLLSIKPDGRMGQGTFDPGSSGGLDFGFDMMGPLNIRSGGADRKVIFIDGKEALWHSAGSDYFSWGFGAGHNYFADRVGIGTSSPDAASKLHINGKIRISDGT